MDLRGQKLGQYELREQLGQGGMAQVYKAFQPGLERFVAVKVMLGHLAGDEEFIERFRREARAVGQLRHPHIVNVFDFGIEDQSYYMVMEFIRGENLKAYINKHPQGLPIDDALRIASQIASALDYAHNAGMVHRDVKPANIMFVDDTHRDTVLTDFGIAHILSQPGLTASGAMVGTPAYLSPDAAYGKNVDERADIYGLGIILYEMLTGKVPYNADTPMAIIMKHVNAPLPSRADFGRAIPEVVESIVLKAMQKNADDRYQTAAEMQAAIDKARSHLADTEVRAPAETTRPQTTPTARRDEDAATTLITPPSAARSPLLWVGGLVILALVVVIVALLNSSGSIGSVAVSETQILEPTEVAAIESATDEPTELPPTATIESTDVPPTATTEPSSTPTDEPLVVANVPEELRGSALLSGLTPLQDEIDAQILQGDTEPAWDHLDDLLETDPENIDALTARSLLATWEGDTESALDDADQVIELAPESPLGYIARSDALRNWDIEDWEGAQEAAEKALELDPDNPDILWRLSDTQDRLEDVELARATLQHAIDEGAHGFRFVTYAAEHLYYAGDYEHALPYLQSWYAYDPFDYSMALLVGALLQLGRPDEAYSAVQDYPLTLIEPGELRTAAFAAFKAGEYDAAREWAETARAVSDDNAAATYIMGLISWYGDHDLEQALAYLDDVPAADFYDDLLSPQFGHEINLDKGKILSEAGEFRAAIGAYHDSLNSLGEYPGTYEALADAYLALGQPNTALENLRSALNVTYDEDPELQQHLTTRIREVAREADALPDTFVGDVNLLSGLTPLQDELDTLYLQGAMDAVRERITSILADDPDNIEALTAQSLFQTLNENPRLATRIAGDIVRTYPESPLGYIALSDAQRHWRLDNFLAAEEAIERALAIDPENPEILWRASWLQDHLGNWERFVELQDRAIANGARGFRFATFAGEWLYYRGEYDRALPYAEAWYEFDPNDISMGILAATLIQLDEVDAAYDVVQSFPYDRTNAETLAWSAYVAYAAEDYDQALEWAETGVREFPDSLNTRYIMGLLKWHAEDDLDGALEYLDQLADIPNVNDVFMMSATGHQINYDRGLIFLDAGEVDAAIEAFEISLEQDPRWYTYAALAEAYIEKDDPDAARENLETALDMTDDPDNRDELESLLDELE